MAYAFISSPVRGLKDIRAALRAGAPKDRPVYIDELDHPRDMTVKLPSFVTLEDLFREINAATVMVILFAVERHGSGLEVGDQVAHASYWEAELFYAILTGKPTHVFQTEDFAPEPKLAALLEVLRRALPSFRWHGPLPRARLVPSVLQLLEDQTPVIAPPGPRRNPLVARLVDGFFWLRGTDARGGEAEHEALQFFSGPPVDATVLPNERVITRLFEELTTLQDEEGRLTRLWVIFRELLGRPSDDPDFLPYWNRFYREWGTAGSWYGLHSHHYFAVLPAFVAQAKLRARLRELASAEWKNEPMFYPAGPLASTRYSIAGLCGSWITRYRLLQAARADLARGLAEGVQKPADLLAVRGSVHRRMGAFWAANRDYYDVLRLRQRDGSGDGPVGEAMAELGFGLLFELEFWRGRDLLAEGVELLRGSRPGFLIRAKRKLARAHRLTGNLTAAKRESDEADALARQHGVLDQLR